MSFIEEKDGKEINMFGMLIGCVILNALIGAWNYHEERYGLSCFSWCVVGYCLYPVLDGLSFTT